MGGLGVEQGAVLIVGILAGTLCWWLILSGITAHFRDRITGKIYRWLNCVLGCLMVGVGIIMLIQGIIGNSLPENERPQSFSNIETDEFSVGTESEGRSEEMNILMKISDEAVTVTWEDNESARALTEFLREQPLSIQMSMYGGFEQVGSLGTSKNYGQIRR